MSEVFSIARLKSTWAAVEVIPSAVLSPDCRTLAQQLQVLFHRASLLRLLQGWLLIRWNIFQVYGRNECNLLFWNAVKEATLGWKGWIKRAEEANRFLISGYACCIFRIIIGFASCLSFSLKDIQGYCLHLFHELKSLSLMLLNYLILMAFQGVCWEINCPRHILTAVFLVIAEYGARRALQNVVISHNWGS